MFRKFNTLFIKPFGKKTFKMTIEANLMGFWPINDWMVTTEGNEITIIGCNPEIDDVEMLCDDYIDYIEYQYNIAMHFQNLSNNSKQN